MSSIKDNVVNDYKTSLKNRDKTKVVRIKQVMAAFQRYEVDHRTNVDDDKAMQILMKLIKQTQKASELYQQGGRKDLIEQAQAEIQLMENYLPKAVSQTQLNHSIESIIASLPDKSSAQMGQVMSMLKKQLSGPVDWAKISKQVKQLLEH
jgi:uncharacterized protein